jgi:hypothetical protein
MSETRPDGKSAGLLSQSGSSTRIGGKLCDDLTVLFQHSQDKLQFLALEEFCVLQTELQIYRALAKRSCAITAKALVLFPIPLITTSAADRSNYLLVTTHLHFFLLFACIENTSLN